MDRIKPIQVQTSGTSVVVNVHQQDQIQEFVYEEPVTAKEVSTSLAKELGLDFDVPTIDKIEKTVEEVQGTYFQKIEFSLTLGGIAVSITRAPKKMFKAFLKGKK